MVSKQRNLHVHLPFVEHGLDKAAVVELLEASGLGLPSYYRWRSRSGCTFCFYQQKIEWVRLKQEHPEAFEEAKQYEKEALANHSPFTWSQGESLSELEQANRVSQIQENHKKRLARLAKNRVENPLNPTSELVDLDEVYGATKMCLACHK
jgi:hypothetical protein